MHLKSYHLSEKWCKKAKVKENKPANHASVSRSRLALPPLPKFLCLRTPPSKPLLILATHTIPFPLVSTLVECNWSAIPLEKGILHLPNAPPTHPHSRGLVNYFYHSHCLGAHCKLSCFQQYQRGSSHMKEKLGDPETMVTAIMRDHGDKGCGQGTSSTFWPYHPIFRGKKVPLSTTHPRSLHILRKQAECSPSILPPSWMVQCLPLGWHCPFWQTLFQDSFSVGTTGTMNPQDISMKSQVKITSMENHIMGLDRTRERDPRKKKHGWKEPMFQLFYMLREE